MSTSMPEARVVAVTGNIVSFESSGAIMKNSIAFVRVGDARLKGEVLRVQGNSADAQIFDETQGMRIGDSVETTSEMLSATLGPGLLGTVYDGLQNPLNALAKRDGFFLARGKSAAPLDPSRKWSFVPGKKPGDRLRPGDVTGSVAEHRFRHKIMLLFAERGDAEVVSILWV